MGEGQRAVCSVQGDVLAPLLAVGDSSPSLRETLREAAQRACMPRTDAYPLSAALMHWPKYEGFLRSHHRALEGLPRTLERLPGRQALGGSPLQS